MTGNPILEIKALHKRFGDHHVLKGIDFTVEPGERVAIIGMGLRLPGARNARQLWQLLQSGGDAVTDFSIDELRAEGVSSDLLARDDYIRAKPCIEGIDHFDAD